MSKKETKKKKYRVMFKVIECYYYDVEAESEEEAESIAEDRHDNDCGDCDDYKEIYPLCGEIV